MTDGTLTVECPAKLNVFLEVVSKRTDGFHELETVMLRTRFCDQLKFSLRNDPEICMNIAAESEASAVRQFPLDDSNLILRAAKLLRDSTGCRLGADIRVIKKIPAQAGLAGGSSNAASTLRGLNSLWELGLSDDGLHELASQLGSDINFLLSGYRAAVCRGRGEIVSPVAVSGDWFFVACRPEPGNSTPDVFKATILPTRPLAAHQIENALRHGTPKQLEQYCFNRLTQAALELNPAMSQLMTDMQQLCECPVFMSGSGSTCFVVAANAQQAQDYAARLRQHLSWPVWILEC